MLVCYFPHGKVFSPPHLLLNRRCTRLPGCIRLQNDLYCVEWGVKLYSLTHLPCIFPRGDQRWGPIFSNYRAPLVIITTNQLVANFVKVRQYFTQTISNPKITLNLKENMDTDSGAGTNLKVGGTGPKQKWGALIRR